MKEYKVTEERRVSEHLCNVALALEALCDSIVLNRPDLVKDRPSILEIEAKYLNEVFELDLNGRVMSSIDERSSSPFIVRCYQRTDKQLAGGFKHWTSGFRRVVNAIFAPNLVYYFERNKLAAKEQFQEKYPSAWPESWYMAWAIRNATVHDGRVFENSVKEPKPVVWRGLTHQKSDDGRSLLLNRFGPGDFLSLLLQMDEDLERSSNYTATPDN